MEVVGEVEGLEVEGEIEGLEVGGEVVGALVVNVTLAMPNVVHADAPIFKAAPDV